MYHHMLICSNFIEISFMNRIFLFFVLFTASNVFAQTSILVVSGPMVGHTELRSSKIWMELQPNVKGVKLSYHEIKNEQNKGIGYQVTTTNPYTNTVVFEMNDLRSIKNSLKCARESASDLKSLKNPGPLLQ